MRILLVTDPMIPVPPSGYGGIERIVDSLAREYRRRGHTVGLVARPGSTCPVDSFFPLPCTDVASRRSVFPNARALARASATFKPDLIHNFSRLAHLLFLLPRRVPKIMSYQRHTGPRPVRLARLLGGRSLRFTGCSDFICAQGRRGGGAWRAIPNFVDLESYTFRPAVPADAPLVFLSRVESIKGPALAIDIAKASGRRLIVAGNRQTSGPESEYFDREISPRVDRDGVTWIGEVDDGQKNTLLGSAAALLVPIQWDEPFGIVFAEALAAGTPVISCARGALPEIVDPGRTGFFINGIDDGVRAVSRIRELDRASCRRVAETQFSLQVCADQYLSLYEEACK